MRGTVASNFGEALKQAALLGHGIAMHPYYMVSDDLKAKRLVAVLPGLRAAGARHLRGLSDAGTPAGAHAAVSRISQALGQDAAGLVETRRRRAVVSADDPPVALRGHQPQPASGRSCPAAARSPVPRLGAVRGPTRNWTYRQFATDAARLAGGLAERGIGPGDRVLVHFENCPETLLARFALARLGAVCVATNAMAAGPEITHYAGSSRATAAITQAKFAELVASHAPDVKWIAVADSAGANSGDGSDSFACAVCRSGTGSPGAAFRHRGHHVHDRHNRKAEGRRVDAGECAVGLQIQRAGLRASSEDVSLISLPLFHVVGLCWSFLPVLWAGGTAVLQPRFSASRFWPASLEHRATLASQVLFTSMALQSQPVPERHFYRQWTVARGDSASQSYNRIPSFVPSWGMTETDRAGHLRRSAGQAGRRRARQAVAGA